MSSKITASLFVLMFYMNFMGPFVLKNHQPHLEHRNLALKKVSNGTLKFLLVTLFLSFGFAIFGCIALLITVVWPLIILIPVMVGIYYAHKAVVNEINIRQRNRTMERFLSQANERLQSRSENLQSITLDDNDGISALGSTDKTPINSAEKEAIIRKTAIYTDMLKEKYQIDKKMEAATKVTAMTYARRFAKSIGFLKPEAPKPGLSGEQMKKQMRGVYSYDFQLRKDLAAELSKNPQSNTEGSYIETEKRKRSVYRQKLSYAINLVKLNYFKDKKFESSPQYKRLMFPVELANLDKELADLNKKVATLAKKPEEKKKVEEERDKIAAQITEVMNRDDPSKTKEQKEEEDMNRIVKHYRWGGIRLAEMETRFFEAYSRAAVWVLLQFEKIEILTEIKERTLTEELKTEARKAIKTLEDKSDELLKGSDLK